jgi:uncharacterized damage-inducible protein DinB
MTSEQAQFLLGFLAGSIEFEIPITQKVLAAVPHDAGASYRPDPKSRSALELAWHIANSERWFLDSILTGSFGNEEERIPSNVKGGGDVAAWYAHNIPQKLEQVKQLPVDKLLQNLDFYGMFNNPAVTYLNFLLVHTVHHRGQLSAYLRPVGSKVPSIYGGSADEPMAG